MLDELQTLFLRLGEFSDMASVKAMASLNRLVGIEAGLRTYHDMFILLAVISAAGILPALWMGNRRAEVSIEDAAEPEPEPETSPPAPLPVAVHHGDSKSDKALSP